MTTYRCNKKFNAYEISEIDVEINDCREAERPLKFFRIRLVNADSKLVSAAWMRNNLAKLGGYLLVDENDCFSYSSADEFKKYYSGAEDLILMPLKLTAENGAKGVMSGEFKETLIMSCEHCDGDGFTNGFVDIVCEECDGAGDYSLGVAIGWDTIKEVYDRIVGHFDKKGDHDVQRDADGRV